jgi:hypothetical protein
LARAAQMQSHIRVVKQQPTPVLASLLDAEFSDQVGWIDRGLSRGNPPPPGRHPAIWLLAC